MSISISALASQMQKIIENNNGTINGGFLSISDIGRIIPNHSNPAVTTNNGECMNYYCGTGSTNNGVCNNVLQCIGSANSGAGHTGCWIVVNDNSGSQPSR